MYMYILHRESYGITNCFLFKGFALNFQVPIVLQDIPVGKQSISVRRYSIYNRAYITYSWSISIDKISTAPPPSITIKPP